jgi:N4-gp56 family major capsid protein
MVNVASKYSQLVDEKFRLGSLTQAATNKNYDWSGVRSISMYSVDTVPMIDYRWATNVFTREVTVISETQSIVNSYYSSRYGDATELENNRQWADVTRDRAFTFTIDKGNQKETKGAMKAKKALERQIEEVVVPEVDVYRLSVMSASAIANGQVSTGAITEENSYPLFLEATKFQTENKVPAKDRITFVSPAFYKFLKLNDQFITASDIGQRMLIKGQVGMIDGVRIILIPTSYLPANIAFILTHPLATVGPTKLEDYKIHKDPSGLSGQLVEGRIIYDAVVSENKKQALYVHKTL